MNLLEPTQIRYTLIMVPEKLLVYLREQKQKGYPDAMVKGQFLQRGWPESVLNEAYAQINGVQSTSKSDESALSSIIAASPPPTPPQDTPVEATIPTQPVPSTQTEPPKKWVTSLMVLLFLLSGEYGAHGGRFVMLIFILQAALNKGGVTTSIVANYPTLLIAIILSLGIGWFYFYLGFKSRNFSEKSWLLTAISLLSVPFVYYPLLNLLARPLLEQAAAMNKTEVNLILPGIDILIALSIASVLWKTKSLHVNPDKPLSMKVRIWLVAVSILSFLSLIGSSIVIGRASTALGDLDYEIVSTQAGYKLYSINVLPDNLAFSTKYELKTEEDGTQSVRIALGTPLSQLREDNNVTIIVSQTKVLPGYEITNQFAGYLAEPEIVNLDLAVNQTAYFGKKQLGSAFLGNLAFVTPDGVLINVMGPNIELPQLLDIASRLE